MKRLLLLIAVLFSLSFSLYAQQTDGVVLDAKGRVAPQKKMKSNYSKDAKFAFKAEGKLHLMTINDSGCCAYR